VALPGRRGRKAPDSSRRVRIFCDADVLIAGAASTTGASHILLQLFLLQLSELTLLVCLTSQYAIQEAERNLLAKLPDALPAFRLILEVAAKVTPAPAPWLLLNLAGEAHPKDLAILAAAISGKADFLATFNTRDFRPRKTAPIIFQPRDVLARIRWSLAHLVE
jgi:predicted nucleic acid-binding protein